MMKNVFLFKVFKIGWITIKTNLPFPAIMPGNGRALTNYYNCNIK
jgi:hypothetical protein